MRRIIVLTILFALLAASCGDNGYTPKPKGYMRIDLPARDYVPVDTLTVEDSKVPVSGSVLPFSFEFNTASQVSLKKNERRLKWVDIRYPEWSGIVFLTYIPLSGKSELAGQIDTSYQLLSKHFDFSSGVDERLFVNEAENVYATTYRLQGNNVASTYQFWATDSVNHFLRGSLYIDCIPNNDSLSPVIEYMQADIDHLLETLKWR